jgi:hypothetical protein
VGLGSQCEGKKKPNLWGKLWISGEVRLISEGFLENVQ